MKAYYLSIANDDEGFTEVVFADTPSKAKAQINGTDLYYEEWTDIRVRRAPWLDGKEHLTKRELDHLLWRVHGWRWYEMDTPEPEETTDEEYFEWYDREFK